MKNPPDHGEPGGEETMYADCANAAGHPTGDSRESSDEQGIRLCPNRLGYAIGFGNEAIPGGIPQD